MQNKENKLDESLKFVAKHYKQGVFNPAKTLDKIIGREGVFTRRIIVWSSVAAMVALLVIGGTQLLQSPKNTVLTAETITRITSLPDQSKITLEPGTVLTYDKSFGKNNRQVLLKGKARFEVTKDGEKPFVVHTESAQVTVLGTNFSVESVDNVTNLKTYSGKVRFAGNDFGVPFICTQDMTVQFNAEKQEIHVSSPESSCIINQNEERIVFNNLPIDEVCRILNHFYRHQLTLPENEKAIRLTSSFNKKSIDEILEIINQTLDTHIYINQQ